MSDLKVSLRAFKARHDERNASFEDYRKVMKAMDEVLDLLESTDPSGWSLLQVRDVQEYVKRHMSAAAEGVKTKVEGLARAHR